MKNSYQRHFYTFDGNVLNVNCCNQASISSEIKKNINHQIVVRLKRLQILVFGECRRTNNIAQIIHYLLPFQERKKKYIYI